jgi:16S rRNA (cytosine1402-N4)-methyltransferase
MRFDRDDKNLKKAKDILALYSDRELENIFRHFGEERRSRFIATEIIKRRKDKPIEDTQELVEIIEKNSFDPKSKARIFQALRMEVNNEL